jgi:hypothetical protein
MLKREERVDDASQGGLHLLTCSKQTSRSARSQDVVDHYNLPFLCLLLGPSQLGRGDRLSFPIRCFQDFQQTWLEALR